MTHRAYKLTTVSTMLDVSVPTLKSLIRRGELKIPRIHLHDLRHTAATGMVNLGMSEHFEAALLGHTPSSMTRRYARPKPEALRPWVEEWAGLVLGEAKMRQTGT